MLRSCNCHHDQDIEQFCHPSPQIPMDPFAVSPFLPAPGNNQSVFLPHNFTFSKISISGIIRYAAF